MNVRSIHAHILAIYSIFVNYLLIFELLSTGGKLHIDILVLTTF